MTLIDVVGNLTSLDQEGTIFAAEPWAPSSESVVELEPEDGGLPDLAKKLGAIYFLEIAIAQEFLDGWLSNCSSQPSLEEKCLTLIHYARFDA